ncbi:MAG TPA: COX15/CtaA family protein [Steroidobacteraceae bacterium]|jgi:cytochrome c oxidase assembly protein subunit 15|nr:COX15/CtaA family protein [Steroidobacteraceae bacterium]
MHSRDRVMWFRRLALAGALLAACVVVLGAWVRLTDAGLGCPDWPGCYGHPYPEAAQAGGFHFAKAWHEMIHRYFASGLVMIIVALFVWAVRFREDRAQPVVPALLLLPLVCVQAALGALTVTLLLKPFIVTSHLLGGLTTFALLWWLSLTPATRELTEPERALRAFACVGLAVLILQIALGGWTSSNYAAVACPDFPTCQRSWWPHMDFRDAFVLWRGLGVDFEGGVLAHPARVAIHFTHRLGAAAAGSILLVLGALTAYRAKSRRLRTAGLLLVLAVLLQITIGIAMVHLGVPLPLATLHNAGAAFLVLCMVTLLRALWPVPAIGMVTLQGADPPR